MNALRAFAAAGRRLSLTRAAEELDVTAAAVSHQIKSLEAYLGVKLFRRLNRALPLTDAGQPCLPGLRDGFERLVAAVEAARLQIADRVSVSVAPSFAAKWLVPRLDHIYTQHPGTDIRVDASTRLVDPLREDVDLCIRYGQGNYPGLHVECLIADEVMPVCSPELPKGRDPLQAPADLRRQTLLHADLSFKDVYPNWRMWLAAAGGEGRRRRSGAAFRCLHRDIESPTGGQRLRSGRMGLASKGAAPVSV